MNNLNSVLLEGTCVSKPVVDTLEGSGKAICSFEIESVRNEQGCQREVSLFEIEAQGRLALTIGQTITEGRGMRIVGRMKQVRLKDDAGQDKSRILVIAEHVEVKPQGGMNT